jgi:hypothetical protein
MRRLPLALLLLAIAAPVSAAPRPGTFGPPGVPAASTCIDCHSALDEPRLNAPAKAADTGIHYQQGITCAGCHGGDPRAEDPEAAMDKAKGFVGKFTARAIPPMCGSCHGDATFMLKYAPNIPTDQLSQYRTSKHGLALASGDANVATCASCHGAHGILAPSDPRSPVYPTHIVDTCGKCHANPDLMHRYGISGKEVADYERSVHYAALTQKSDLSAPTCKSCHGAHGATPPGVESVANVCGTCHVTQEGLFDGSPHKAAFAAIDQPSCEACHSNHAILHPQDSWIGTADEQVCGQCHSAGDAGASAAGEIARDISDAVAASTAAEHRVEAVQRAGMLMDDALVRLQDAHQNIVLARNAVHTVTPAAVAKPAGEALKAAAAADQMAAKAEADLHYRRMGLFVSLIVIVVAIVALTLKIRQMER